MPRNENSDKSPVDYAKDEMISTEKTFHDSMKRLQTWNKENYAAGILSGANYPNLSNLLNEIDKLLEVTPHMIAMWERSSEDFSVFEQDDTKQLLKDYFNILSSATNAFAAASKEELYRFGNDDSLNLPKKLDNGVSVDTVLSAPMQRTMRVAMPLDEIKNQMNKSQNDYNENDFVVVDGFIDFVKKLCQEVNENVENKNFYGSSHKKYKSIFSGVFGMFRSGQYLGEPMIVDNPEKGFDQKKYEALKEKYGRKEGELQPKDDLTTFVKMGDTLYDITSDEPHTATSALQGRGQAGLANFYVGPDNQERLIKEDKIEVCLMEGTAYYAKDFLPDALAHSVNFATVGTVFNEDDNEPFIVSIQDRVVSDKQDSKVRPWDELVYGVKRNPKTGISFEAWYPGKILDNISFLNAMPKWQLAAGIAASAIVGDESLHVGQFVAIVNEDNVIEGIKRIDLGARERYAVARSLDAKDQDPYHASSLYKSSGQFGKDYVSYLLAEPTLHKMYTMLWMNLSSVPDLERTVMERSKQAFIQQFAVISQELHADALTKVLETINKSAINPIVLNKETTEEKIEELAFHIADIDARRVTNMVKKGEQVYADYEQAISAKYTSLFPPELRTFCSDCMKLQKKITLNRDFSVSDMEDVFKKAEMFSRYFNAVVQNAKKSSKPDPKLFEGIQVLTELNNDLMHALTLNLQYRPDLLSQYAKPINDYLDKSQTLNDLATYCKETSSRDKIQYVLRIMENTLKGRNELIGGIKNADLVNALKQHSSRFGLSLNAGNQTKGEILLLKLYKRYHLNDKLVTMTNVQRTLIEDIKKRNFKRISGYINKLYIDDSTVLDENGKTALHYLMELENPDKDVKDIIATILKSSIGNTYNTNLNIPDKEGHTPLDSLMANPNAESIVTAIAEKGIVGISGGQYFIKDFFQMDSHDETYNERLAAISQPAKESKRGWW